MNFYKCERPYSSALTIPSSAFCMKKLIKISKKQIHLLAKLMKLFKAFPGVKN